MSTLRKLRDFLPWQTWVRVTTPEAIPFFYRLMQLGIYTIALGMVGLSAYAGLSIQALPLHARENGIITLIFASAILIFYLIKDRNFLRTHGVLIISCIVAALVVTTQAQSMTVQTDIPRLRHVVRLLFYGFLIITLIMTMIRAKRETLLLFTGLFLLSFPFQSAYIYNPVTAMCVAICLCAALLTMNLSIPTWFYLVPTVVLLSALPGILGQADAPRSLGYIWLLFIPLAMGLVAASLERAIPGSVLSLVALFFFVNFAYLLSALTIQGVSSGTDWILSRKTSFADINSNDASAFISLFFPLAYLTFKHSRILLALVLASLAIFIVISGVRIAFIVFIAIFCLLNIPRKYWLGIILIAPIVIVVALPLLPAIPVTSFETFRMRYALWNIADEMIRSNPFEGGGPLQYCAIANTAIDERLSGGMIHLKLMAQEHSGCFVAHNVFLQLALDGGIFHSMLVISVLSLAAIALFQQRAIGNGRFLWPIGFGLLFQGLFNYHFVIPLYLTFFSVLCGAQFSHTESSIKSYKGLIRISVLVLLATAVFHFFALNYRNKAILALWHGTYKNATGAWVLANPIPATNLAIARLELKNGLAWFDSPEYHELLAEVELLDGQHEAAKEQFSSCASRGDFKAHCFNRLSSIYRAEGNFRLSDEMSAKSKEHDTFGILDTSFLRKFP